MLDLETPHDLGRRARWIVALTAVAIVVGQYQASAADDGTVDRYRDLWVQHSVANLAIVLALTSLVTWTNPLRILAQVARLPTFVWLRMCRDWSERSVPTLRIAPAATRIISNEAQTRWASSRGRRALARAVVPAVLVLSLEFLDFVLQAHVHRVAHKGVIALDMIAAFELISYGIRYAKARRRPPFEIRSASSRVEVTARCALLVILLLLSMVYRYSYAPGLEPRPAWTLTYGDGYFLWPRQAFESSGIAVVLAAAAWAIVSLLHAVGEQRSLQHFVGVGATIARWLQAILTVVVTPAVAVWTLAVGISTAFGVGASLLEGRPPMGAVTVDAFGTWFAVPLWAGGVLVIRYLDSARRRHEELSSVALAVTDHAWALLHRHKARTDEVENLAQVVVSGRTVDGEEVLHRARTAQASLARLMRDLNPDSAGVETAETMLAMHLPKSGSRTDWDVQMVGAPIASLASTDQQFLDVVVNDLVRNASLAHRPSLELHIDPPSLALGRISVSVHCDCHQRLDAEPRSLVVLARHARRYGGDLEMSAERDSHVTTVWWRREPIGPQGEGLDSRRRR